MTATTHDTVTTAMIALRRIEFVPGPLSTPQPPPGIPPNM